jgi:hypothetical protein
MGAFLRFSENFFFKLSVLAEKSFSQPNFQLKRTNGLKVMIYQKTDMTTPRQILTYFALPNAKKLLLPNCAVIEDSYYSNKLST